MADDARTIHERATHLARTDARYVLTADRMERSTAPAWLRERILRTTRRAALRRAARQAVEIERPAQPTAAWLEHKSLVARHYAVAAQTVHRECGCSGQTVREIVRAMTRTDAGRLAAIEALPPCPVDPVYWAPPSYSEQHWRAATHTPTPTNAQRWVLYWAWHVERAIAESDLDAELARLAAHPDARISGYLAESILSYQGVPCHDDYSGCSGCAWYALVRERPELWPRLMARAPRGASGDGWEQTYPHERARAAACEARGWEHTLRLSDSIWRERR